MRDSRQNAGASLTDRRYFRHVARRIESRPYRFQRRQGIAISIKMKGIKTHGYGCSMGCQRPAIGRRTESPNLDLDLVYPCVYDILLQTLECSNVPLRFGTVSIDRHKHKHSSSLSVVFLTVPSSKRALSRNTLRFTGLFGSVRSHTADDRSRIDESWRICSRYA